MDASGAGRWSEPFHGTAIFAPGRALAIARRVCTPANLLLCTVIAVGWLALVGWTGAGPDGWQARLCADLDRQPRACAAIHLSGDAGLSAGSAGSAS